MCKFGIIAQKVRGGKFFLAENDFFHQVVFPLLHAMCFKAEMDGEVTY